MFKLNFFFPISFFENMHYKMKCLPSFFVLCNLLGPPSLNRFIRLFPSICNCYHFRNFLVTKGVTQWFLTRALITLIALLLPEFIFIPFSTAHSPKVSRSFCNFSLSFLFVIFLHIIESPAKSLILELMFLQISFTYTRNSNGATWG